MALPPIIEDKDKTWLFKVITQSPEPELNACLMGFFLGTGMTGIEQPSILSGRRTFAVRLKRQGVDTPTIYLTLGNKTLDTTLRLIEADTVNMLAIADMAF